MGSKGELCKIKIEASPGRTDHYRVYLKGFWRFCNFRIGTDRIRECCWAVRLSLLAKERWSRICIGPINSG